MIKRLSLSFTVCVLFVAFLLLIPIAHSYTGVVYAANPCMNDDTGSGQQFTAPTVSNGPYPNGHGSYYVEAKGYDCIGSIVNCGHYGCEDFQVNTAGFLSNGGGVLYVNDAGQGQESCNGSAYGTQASYGGWINNTQATTVAFSFPVHDCQTGHDYRLVSQHGAQMYSGQVANETVCVYPTVGDSHC